MKKQQLQETTNFLKLKGFQNPEIGIVLGTGLGQLINEIVLNKKSPTKNSTFSKSNCRVSFWKLVYGSLSGKK